MERLPNSNRRIRALLIAEAANPEWTSVPLVGWSHARALQDVVDGHVVTQVRNRDAFQRAGVGPDSFTAIDSEAVAGPMVRLAERLRGGVGKGWTTITAVSSLTYGYFEWLVWRRFRDQIRAGEYDLVHRITPLSPTTPSLLARRCRRAGVPFILGPLNGGVPWPATFDRSRRAEREWLSYVRGAHKLLPGYHATRRHASAIIIGSRDTWKQMPERYWTRCVYIPENAVDGQRFSITRSHRAELPLRLVFLGRLVPYKGADMLLEAAAPLLREGKVRLQIIGDGPQSDVLRAMAAREDLAEAVQFAGWVAHGEVPRRLAEADLLVLPSIREFGGGVVLEAMAVGLPAMVVEYGGPAELVTPSSGFSIPLGSREEIVSALRSRLTELVDDPSKIDRKSGQARERVRRWFTWDVKAQQTVEVYRWVLGQSNDRPDFGMPFPESPPADTNRLVSAAAESGQEASH